MLLTNLRAISGLSSNGTGNLTLECFHGILHSIFEPKLLLLLPELWVSIPEHGLSTR
jgi:hypothetical protein